MNHRQTLRSYRDPHPSVMQHSPGKLLLLGAAVTAGVMILMQLPELRRYLRIRTM